MAAFDTLALLTPRRLTVDEYHRMIAAGIFHEDDPVELLEGLLVKMTPQGRPHAFAIQRLTQQLVSRVGAGYAVLPQLPLTLGEDSEPEPDLAIVDVREASSRDHHPTTAVLVIEVSGEALRSDRAIKGALYARAGIPEYWIVNLAERVAEIYRNPDSAGSRYRLSLKRTVGETVSCDGIPDLILAVSDILG